MTVHRPRPSAGRPPEALPPTGPPPAHPARAARPARTTADRPAGRVPLTPAGGAR